MPRAAVLGAPDRSAIGAPIPLHLDAAARRPSWKYPLVGAALGVVAGIGYGAYLHSRIEPGNTLSGPPAYFMTVPLGAIGGLVLGMIGNSVHPSDAR